MMDGNEDLPDYDLYKISSLIDDLLRSYMGIPKLTNQQYQDAKPKLQNIADEAKSRVADLIAERNRMRELLIRPTQNIGKEAHAMEDKPLLFYPPITMK